MAEGRNYNYARIDKEKCIACGRCLSVCPSEGLLVGAEPGGRERAEEEGHWLTHSTDEETRRDGASGGFVTGLLGDLVERRIIDGAILVRADKERPFHNVAVTARTKEGILEARGSRYGPASACAAITEALSTPGRYAFVGKGCEISALRRLQRADRTLAERVVLAVGLFCARTPARTRARRFVRTLGVEPADVRRIDFRGGGWPGTFKAIGVGGVLCQTQYRTAWDYLAAALPALRCFLCADAAAEEADISAGDPWGLDEGHAKGSGLSYVITRTRAGEEAVREGLERGAIGRDAAPADFVRRRDEAFRARREAVHGRRATHEAIFGVTGRRRSISGGGLAGIRTVLSQKLRFNYY